MSLSTRAGIAAAAVLLVFTACGSPDADVPETDPIVASSASQTEPESTAPAEPVTSDPAPADSPAETSSAPEEPAMVEPLPFNANAMLGGDAQPSLAAGEPGEVSVVQVGPLDVSMGDSGVLLFAFRNNTSEGISHVDWSATARSGGSIVATGSSQGTVPAQLQPGEAGLAYIYFDNGASIPEGAEYEFAAETSPVDTDWYNTAPFKVTEANVVGEEIVGSAVNETGAVASGPFSADVYCFDGDNLVGSGSGFAEQDGPIEDGGSVTFSVSMYDECPSFTLGVSGWFD